MATEEKKITEIEHPMRTAKEIAFKAFCHNLPQDVDYATADLEMRFNNWWAEWFHRGEHRGCFYPEHNIFVESHRYIRAE